MRTLPWPLRITSWFARPPHEKSPRQARGFDFALLGQAAEMLNGAAGKLVGMGSGWPSAMALARLYMKLLVAPSASMAAATTAQLRISVVIVKKQ